MLDILQSWEPQKWYTKALKKIIVNFFLLSFLSLFVLPFLTFSITFDFVKWAWIVVAVINSYMLFEYKNTIKTKRVYLAAAIYISLTIIYLHNFWGLIPLSLTISLPIIAFYVELVICIWRYRTIYKYDGTLLGEYDDTKVKKHIMACVFFTAIILFVAALFINDTMVFVFGGISAVLLGVSILISISRGFKGEKKELSVAFTVFDILVFLALIVYLIYIIPERYSNLQTIILTIVSSVLGGALTLAGVAWTIKKTDDDRKAEERKKAEPIFTYRLLSTDSISKDECVCAAFYEKNAPHNYANIAHLINSDNSNFYIRAIKYKHQWIPVDKTNCVLKNKNIYFVLFTPDIDDDNESMYVKLEDTLGFYHYYEFKYSPDVGHKLETYTFAHSIKKISEEDANR